MLGTGDALRRKERLGLQLPSSCGSGRCLEISTQKNTREKHWELLSSGEYSCLRPSVPPPPGAPGVTGWRVLTWK